MQSVSQRSAKSTEIPDRELRIRENNARERQGRLNQMIMLKDQETCDKLIQDFNAKYK